MKEKLRGYFFGNFYLSSIQQGIQAAHVMQVMLTKYLSTTELQSGEYEAAGELFEDWCVNDRTMILLNGGMQSTLFDLYTQLYTLSDGGKKYPIAYFKEERAALNEAVTGVGIVLPESVYDMMKELMKGTRIDFDENDVQLAELLSQYKTAI